MKYNNKSSGQSAKTVVMDFMSFIIQEGHVSLNGNRQLRKDRLLAVYKTYKDYYNSPLQTSEIIPALDKASVLKRKFITTIEDKTNFVEFNEKIFRDIDIINTIKSRVYIKNQHSVFRNKSERDTGNDERHCHICKKSFNNSKEKQNHLTSKMHKLRDTYRKNRKSFPLTLTNLDITSLPKITLDVNQPKNLVITVKNISSQFFVDRIVLVNVYKLVDLDGAKMITSRKLPSSIIPGENFDLILDVCFNDYGAKLLPIILEFSVSVDTHFVLVEAIFDVLEEELEYLGPIEPYRPLARTAVEFEELKTIEGVHLPHGLNALKNEFPPLSYSIPESLVRILETGFRPFGGMTEQEEFQLRRTRLLLCNRTQDDVLHNKDALNVQNYVSRLHLLMWIEEHQVHKDIHMYNQVNVLLLTNRIKDNYLGVNVPGLAEGRPSILKGDRVYIRRKNDKVRYEGVVHVVEEKTIYVAPRTSLCSQYKYDEKVDIEFAFNRSPLKLSHRALDQIEKRKASSIMFPFACNKAPKKAKLKKPMFNWKIEENPQQVQAVQNIVENRAYPAPYVLFGPPGTGKTATLVEAITQVWKIFSNTRICVCAPSNSAADIITERLLKHIPPDQILRLYGMSRTPSQIPKKLRICSNLDRIKNELFVPGRNQISSKRIVVVTPVTAGRLVTGGIGGGFFNYVFMDEAGHAVEVEMLIPIIGFLTKPKEDGLLGSLILAGDPKQLGPIIRSALAVHLGYDMSLLERLMVQCNLYQRDPKTNEFNPYVITKLINNYRSHPEILHIPNELFYENDLVAMGPKIINCACNWKGLVTPNFPVIFHSVKGLELRESSSPSYFNRLEIQEVCRYLRDLLGTKLNDHLVTQEDIGIITPYRKQVQKIKQHLQRKNWGKVDVASVEEFQGQEKLIIIISTVRSRFEFLATDYQFGLGFLRNEKRFNVAVTRAIALLIVVGNPDILQCDKNWRKLIYYCRQKKSYKGDDPSGDVPYDFDPYTKLAPDLSALTINSRNMSLEDKPGFSRND